VKSIECKKKVKPFLGETDVAEQLRRHQDSHGSQSEH